MGSDSRHDEGRNAGCFSPERVDNAHYQPQAMIIQVFFAQQSVPAIRDCGGRRAVNKNEIIKMGRHWTDPTVLGQNNFSDCLPAAVEAGAHKTPAATVAGFITCTVCTCACRWWCTAATYTLVPYQVTSYQLSVIGSSYLCRQVGTSKQSLVWTPNLSKLVTDKRLANITKAKKKKPLSCLHFIWTHHHRHA